MTKPTRGFPACHYCGDCGAGCDTASFFNSADHLIPFALKTGKLEIRSNAVVARVLVDDKGKARGVQYFDRKTGAEHEVLGKVVVVGASCVDSTRILLNSKSTAYPNGIGNGSDVIGRYLCEQIRLNHAAGCRRWPAGRRATTAASAASTSTCRASTTGRRTSATTCAASACSSGTPAAATPARTTAARRSPASAPSLKKEIKRRHPGVGRDPPVRRGRCRTRTTGSRSAAPARIATACR